MLFRDSPEHAAFRRELREFLRDNLPGDWNMRNDRDHVSVDDEHFTAAFRKKLAASGWLIMGWPKEFGGAGASYMTQTVYMEEMSASAMKIFICGSRVRAACTASGSESTP